MPKGGDETKKRIPKPPSYTDQGVFLNEWEPEVINDPSFPKEPGSMTGCTFDEESAQRSKFYFLSKEG